MVELVEIGMACSEFHSVAPIYVEIHTLVPKSFSSSFQIITYQLLFQSMLIT